MTVPTWTRPLAARVAIARLVEPLTEQVEARGATALLTDIELPLVRVLARMEQAGIQIDVAYLEELGDSLRDRLGTLGTEDPRCRRRARSMSTRHCSCGRSCSTASGCPY